jgi:FKBP-type peptidyl-prolyl cis-trans isomerase FkpA/FKBP-type peptidyl-prolyl cis-trans isomerase FklB
MTLCICNRQTYHGRATSSITFLSAAAIAAALILGSGSVSAQGGAETDDEKAFYAIGAGLSNQIANLKPISDREFEILFQGMRDGVEGKVSNANSAENRPRIRKLMQARQEAGIAIEKEASDAFLAAEARKPGAKKTESGLIVTELKPGSGASPSASNKVKVHYHGTLRDGTVFDSSVDRGKPAEFPLNRVIPCWTEGVAMMQEGGKSRLVCPADIAYGNQRQGRIPPGSVLIFEVELIEIVN